jgi:transcriptional regulator with XRE-family HTH domain
MARDQGDPLEAGGDEAQTQLALRLKEAREYLGVSQQFVADETGLSRAAVSAIETSRRKVEALELERLAALYKFPLSHFLGGGLDEPASVRALARQAAELSENDRAEVLRFAQFLRGFGADPRRAKHR